MQTPLTLCPRRVVKFCLLSCLHSGNRNTMSNYVAQKWYWRLSYWLPVADMTSMLWDFRGHILLTYNIKSQTTPRSATMFSVGLLQCSLNTFSAARQCRSILETHSSVVLPQTLMCETVDIPKQYREASASSLNLRYTTYITDIWMNSTGRHYYSSSSTIMWFQIKIQTIYHLMWSAS